MTQLCSRVFVVDDEHVIASTLAIILELNGYHARYFTSPLEALRAARHEDPDILISDVMMPGMNGIELAIQLTAMSPCCKVLLLSGQAATVDLLVGARAKGHNFRLRLKPLPPSEMLYEIHKLAESNAA